MCPCKRLAHIHQILTEQVTTKTSAQTADALSKVPGIDGFYNRNECVTVLPTNMCPFYIQVYCEHLP